MNQFFREYSVRAGKMYNSNGEFNLSIDGSGIIPSINESNVDLMYPLLKGYKIQLDIGGGMCHLTKMLNEHGIEGYSFEGSAVLINRIVCDKNRVAIIDMSKKINDKRLNRYFDITTSFEVIEHIHRNYQLQFWKNLSYLSQYHLCSIHVMNEEYAEHCTINKPEIWERIFKDLGIKYQKITDFPIRYWECSAYYFLTLPKRIKNVSNFR